MNETSTRNTLYQSEDVNVISEFHGAVYTLTYNIFKTPDADKCKELLGVSQKFFDFCDGSIILILKSKAWHLCIPSAGGCFCITQFFIEHIKLVQNKLAGVCFKVKRKDEAVLGALHGFTSLCPLECPIVIVDDKKEFEEAKNRIISSQCA